MSRLRFLVDEDVSEHLIEAIRQDEPLIDLLVVGEPGAPEKRTPDPGLLLAAEALGRFFLSGDRSTMPRHLADHYSGGHHTAGIGLLRNGYPLKTCQEFVLMIWAASTADEWKDVTVYIPW